MADAKKKNAKKKAPPELTPEQRRKLAEKQVIGAGMALDFRDQAHFYNRAAELLEGIPDDPNCAAQAAEYRAKAEEISKDGWEAAYQAALAAKEAAVTAEEFSQAESAFQRLPNYRDADAMAAECAQRYRHLARKGHPALVVFCLLLALLLAAGVAYQTNWGKYQFAQLCMTTSHYGKAMDTFADLKGYEDSADKETDARYQLAMQHMEKGKYQKAAFHLRKLGDYQDSETQLVTAETQLLQGAQVGDTVPFGTCDWVVLDAQSDGALLTLEKPLKEPQCFNEQKAEVSWTDASLCRWLNDRWMTETFSAEEQAMLRDSDAKSKVFLLSDAEWRSYGSQIKPVKCNWWLRTPSTQKGCAMFVDPYGTIMEAGYPVNAVMKVRPTVWVSYQ